jgi:hypothetical protein
MATEESSFNPADRRLCPDGTCVGLIGSDGRCRACGLRADASTPGGRSTDDLLADEAFAGRDDDDHDAMNAAGGAEGGAPAFQTDRRLCDDGSCVGVVDESGACNVCGRRPG